jgi:hypothetical protein
MLTAFNKDTDIIEIIRQRHTSMIKIEILASSRKIHLSHTYASSNVEDIYNTLIVYNNDMVAVWGVNVVAYAHNVFATKCFICIESGHFAERLDRKLDQIVFVGK